MILIGACVLYGCSADQGSDNVNVEASTTSVQLPQVIQTTSAEEIVIPELLTASGTVAAKQTSNIGTLTSGVIEQIFVRVGDRVTKGQALFKTRTIDYELRLSEAQSMLEIAKAEAANAAAILNRYKGLRDERSVAQVELDAIKKRESIAKAESNLRLTQVKTAEQALADTTVRSPFAGSITARYVDEGVFMTNSFSGMGNSAVVQVQECEIATAILFAPESASQHLRKGLLGALRVDGQPDPIMAEIAIINDRVDTANRQIEFRIPFANPDCAVKAGQSVHAVIQMGDRTALRLTRNVIRGSGETRYVLLAREGAAHRQPVEIRDIDAQFVEITAGISRDDLIIIGGSEQVYDGVKVEVRLP